MFCRKCGSQILDDSNFCQYCGEATSLPKYPNAIEQTVYVTKDEAEKGCHKQINLEGYSGAIDVSLPKEVLKDGSFILLRKIKLKEKEKGKNIKKDVLLKVAINSDE